MPFDSQSCKAWRPISPALANRDLPLTIWFFNDPRLQVAVRRIFYDMGVLMVASGVYQGINVGLRAARGTDDAANLSVAGGVSAAFLGATCKQRMDCCHVLSCLHAEDNLSSFPPCCSLCRLEV